MMNKQSCENHFNSYKDRADTSNCINELESKLKENNLDFKNILTIFTYNREELERYWIDYFNSIPKVTVQ